MFSRAILTPHAVEGCFCIMEYWKGWTEVRRNSANNSCVIWKGSQPRLRLVPLQQGGQRDQALVQTKPNSSTRGKDLSFPKNRTGPVKGRTNFLSMNEASTGFIATPTLPSTRTSKDVASSYTFAALTKCDTIYYVLIFCELRSTQRRTYAAVVASSSTTSAMRRTIRTSAALPSSTSAEMKPLTSKVKHYGKPSAKRYEIAPLSKPAPKQYEPRYPSVALWLQRQALTPTVVPYSVGSITLPVACSSEPKKVNTSLLYLHCNSWCMVL